MRNFFPVLLTFFLLLNCFAAPAEGHSAKPKKILFINSYCTSTPFAHDVMLSFQDYLARHDVHASHEYQELDVCGTPGVTVDPEKTARLQKLLDSDRFDLIVTNGNEAAHLFIDRKLKANPGHTSLIMVNLYDTLWQSGPAELPTTGVLALARPYALVDMGLKLKPEIKRAVFVIGAMDEAREYMRRLRNNRAAAPDIDIEIISGIDHSYPEMLEKLTRLPEDSLVIFHSWNSIKDSNADSSSFVEDLSQKCKALILAGKYSHLRIGAIGGLLVAGRDFGESAGELAVRIFKGETASSIPFAHVTPQPVLDYNALKKYKIDPANIDRSIRLLHAPENIFHDHWQTILIVSIAILLVLQISFLKLFFYRRMITRLKGLMTQMPMQLTLTDVSGKVLYSNIPASEQGHLRKVKHLKELGKIGEFAIGKIISLAESPADEIVFEHFEGGCYYQTCLRKLGDDQLFRTPAFLGVTNNITKERIAQQKLEDMAEHFYQTLHSIGDAVIATDEKECVTFMNPIAEELTGFKLAQAQGMPLAKVFRIINAITGETVNSPLTQALRQGQSVGLANHTLLLSAGGREYHIADSASPIKSKTNEIKGGVLVFRDVTEEYAKSDRTRRMAVILEHFKRTAKFADFIFLPGEKLDFSQLNTDIWGQENGRALPPERWMDAENLKTFYAEYEKLAAGKISEFHLSFTTAPDQPRRYFEMWVVSSHDEHRERNEIHGLIQEVTAIKESEIRYLNNLQMLNTIMDNLPGVLFVKDADNDFRYLTVNSNFTEMLSCTKEETIGHVENEIFAHTPEMAAKFHADDLLVLDSSQPLEKIETLFNGKRHYTLRTIKTIVRQENGPRLLIGMSVDITKQAKLEKEREDMIKDLNQLISWEQLTNCILKNAMQDDDFDSIIISNLRHIGEVTGTEHAYIFRYTGSDRSGAILEYGWDRETGEVKKQIDNVTIDLKTLKDTRNELAAHKECHYTAEPYPDGKWELEQKTMKRFPALYARHFAEIAIEGKPYGFIGLDYSRTNYSPQRVTILIRNLAQLFQLAYERNLKIQQVNENQQFMARLIENIDIPLTLCDEEYNLVMINEKARKNARPEFDAEWRSRKPGEKLKCYDASACGDGHGNPSSFCPVLRCLQTGEPCSIEHEWCGNHMISSGQFLYDKAQDKRYILVADVDMTERVKHEQQLRQALEAAKAAERAKSVFLATMSHEIRTPLNAIIGFSDILAATDLPTAERKESIRAIQFAGNTLLNLINDILDLSKLEAEQMTLVLQKCNFAELFRSIAMIFHLKIRSKGLQYKEIIPDDLPMIELDALRMKQILLNLLGNAVKFTDSGSITATVEFTPADAEKGTLQIQIQDTGCGIRPEYREFIFKPFFQQDIVRDSHANNGTGLGLPISKRLAERMGGKLYLEESAGPGSVFVLEIPNLRYHPQFPAPAQSAADPEEPLTSLHNILIVDDVPLNLKVLGTMLRKSDLNPIEATGAAEALAVLKSGTKVDLVLTDLWMPGMNGAELAETIHRMPGFAELRIIALTADVEMSQNFPMKHFAGQILKPVTFEKLRQVLLHSSAGL